MNNSKLIDKAQVYEPLVCDYCNAETQDPWHGSGMLNGAESHHIHACNQCRNLLPPTKAQGVVLDGSQLAGLLEQVRLDDGEAKPHGNGATYWNNAVIACQVAIRDALAAPVQQVSVPDGATLIIGDTGRKDLDHLIDRLMSSDHDFEDCTAAAALLRRLFMEEISGPKGHATWKDAAVAERLRRVSMRPSETVVAMAREGLAVYSGPNMNERKVCAEIVRLADISDTAMLAAAPAAPAADAGGVLEQAMYTLISIGYHENSGLVHELRQALAAHSAKGVV